jgi:hypothetical protein
MWLTFVPVHAEINQFATKEGVPGMADTVIDRTVDNEINKFV